MQPSIARVDLVFCTYLQLSGTHRQTVTYNAALRVFWDDVIEQFWIILDVKLFWLNNSGSFLIYKYLRSVMTIHSDLCNSLNADAMLLCLTCALHLPPKYCGRHCCWWIKIVVLSNREQPYEAVLSQDHIRICNTLYRITKFCVIRSSIVPLLPKKCTASSWYALSATLSEAYISTQAYALIKILLVLSRGSFMSVDKKLRRRVDKQLSASHLCGTFKIKHSWIAAKENHDKLQDLLDKSTSLS